MSVNVSGFAWSRRRERAALLVAQDDETDQAITAQIGVSERTLERWKQHPTFRIRVQQHLEAWRQATLNEGIADRVQRVRALGERWERMRQVIAARGQEHQHVPGGDTGLLVREVKMVKVYRADDPEEGESEPEVELEPQPHGGALVRRRAVPALTPLKQSMWVEEYAVDTGLLRELRAHED